MKKKLIQTIAISLLAAIPVAAAVKYFMTLITVLCTMVILEMMTESYIYLSSNSLELVAGRKDTMNVAVDYSCIQEVGIKNVSSSGFTIDRVVSDCTMCVPVDYTKSLIQPGGIGFIKVRHKKIKKINGNNSEGDIQLQIKCKPDNSTKKLLIHFSRKVRETQQ
jgi:hypothetical protein